MRKMSKTEAMIGAMIIIAFSVYHMVSSQSLDVALGAVILGFFLMLAVFRYAGRRSPRKALAALVLALICGAIFWSGAV
jgi:uncharacterized MnhB-related membrane protein